MNITNLFTDNAGFDDFINMADDVELFGHGTMQKSFTEKRSKSSKSPKSPSEDDVERERDREGETMLLLLKNGNFVLACCKIRIDQVYFFLCNFEKI